MISTTQTFTGSITTLVWIALGAVLVAVGAIVFAVLAQRNK
jgi:hypothetical protein